MMQAVKISEKVYWVGAIDWNIRDFHGYSTKRGTTYNAYLVMGEKPTLIDTVKKEFYGEMMERIQSVIDPKKSKLLFPTTRKWTTPALYPRPLIILSRKKSMFLQWDLKTLPSNFIVI